MKHATRREFLVNVGLGIGAAKVAEGSTLLAEPNKLLSPAASQESATSEIRDLSAAIDFRYHPLDSQLTYCFPDDDHKSLIGDHGDLRYGHPGLGWGIDYFPEVVEFTLEGMEANDVRW
jgi:hypothetical protein